MTSTFTPNLNLQCQATGDNSNSWGTILNSNVFTNVDTAMGGSFSPDVSGNSDYTLSATNALNFDHILTGVLTGDINYIFPAAAGRYITIYNNTSGAYKVTVKQSGGTGLIVPQGQRLNVHLSASTTTAQQLFTSLTNGVQIGIPLQGTNVGTTARLRFANGSNTNIVTLRAGISGSNVDYVLPIADGGSGQALVTDGSANLSWSSQTIGTAAVSNVMLAQVPPLSIKGNSGTSTTTVSDLTATQATSILNAFVTDSGTAVGTKGLVPAPAAGDASAGKFLAAAGTFAYPFLVQRRSLITGVSTTGTGAFTFGTAAPTSANGNVYMSLAIAPKGSGNILNINVHAETSNDSTGQDLWMGLFQDSGTNCLKSVIWYNAANSHMAPSPPLYCTTTAVSTATTTFNVRIGCTGGTITFNGVTGNQYLGSSLSSYVRIDETTG